MRRPFYEPSLNTRHEKQAAVIFVTVEVWHGAFLQSGFFFELTVLPMRDVFKLSGKRRTNAAC